MDTILAKKSHEDYWLLEGYLLALKFAEGWVVVRITGWEPSNITPYSLGAIAATSNLAAWNEILDANADRQLMPQREEYINHVFWGVSKPTARMYLQYTTRQDRWNLTTAQRTITGNTGYVDGEMSPFYGPFSVKTQLFIINQIYPAFQAYNPLPDAMDNVSMNFEIMRYSYHIIKDRDIIRDALTLRKPAKLYTLGGVDPQPVKIPEWLYQQVSKEYLDNTLNIMSEGR